VKLPPPASTTPPRAGQHPGQALRFVAVLVFVTFALPLFALAGFLAWRQYRVLSTWPAVDALVTKAEWTTNANRASHPPATAYSARFTFRYMAAGRVYDSTVDVGYASTRRSDVERWMAQMPVGSHQRMRYDPRNPGDVTLATDLSSRTFTAPLTLAKWAGVLAVVCGTLFLLGSRASRRQATLSSSSSG
jgi:hypothetical protein